MNMFINMDSIEYPDSEVLVNGLQDNIFYDYVSTTYLNGYINYVEIISAYMIRRYMNESDWIESVKRIDTKNNIHTDVSDSSLYDDILILAKSGKSYIIFWNDCDCSDSCIGKISKSKFISQEEALTQFKEFVEDVPSYLVNKITDENYDDNIKYIKPSFFTGWITL